MTTSNEGTRTGKGSLGRLFVISFVLLFFELACIRWFGSTVVFLTFFTNIVLLATFVGMSVGAGGRRAGDWARLTGPAAAARGAARVRNAVGLHPFRKRDGGRRRAGIAAAGLFRYRVPRAAMRHGSSSRSRCSAATFFALIALIFVGVGQMMGRAFNASHDRLLAYIVNIGGSLAGISGFASLSYLRAPPFVWLAIVAVLWLLLLDAERAARRRAAVLLVVVLLAGAVDRERSGRRTTRFATAGRTGLIDTNNIGHQQMVRTIGRQRSGYHAAASAQSRCGAASRSRRC